MSLPTRATTHVRFSKVFFPECLSALFLAYLYSNGNERSTLLAMGILNSLSAGILLYSALAQIIVQDFIASREMLNASYGKCALAVGYFTAGILVMSILGYWA